MNLGSLPAIVANVVHPVVNLYRGTATQQDVQALAQATAQVALGVIGIVSISKTNANWDLIFIIATPILSASAALVSLACVCGEGVRQSFKNRTLSGVVVFGLVGFGLLKATGPAQGWGLLEKTITNLSQTFAAKYSATIINFIAAHRP